MAAGPLLFYIAWYFLLSYPLVLQFNRAYFMPTGDGQQMIWGIWWVRYAILQLHRSPLSTRMLHFPNGCSLLLHSLTPLNGLLGLPLSVIFTQIQTFNTLIILAFAGSGVTAFWLCWKVTRSYWPSMAGGFAFTFCSYRWAHAMGHLHLISTEAMPLYLMGLLCLLARPRVPTALGTALALLLTLLFDQYQFFFCVLTTAIVLPYWFCSGKGRRVSLGSRAIPFVVFVLAAALFCGPLVLAMLRLSIHSPVVSLHDPEFYSADLLGPWVPDWAWLYNGYTHALWMSPTASYVEKSVCLGPAVVVAAVFAFFPWRGRTQLELGSAGLFALIAAVFIALCFGPTWRFWTMPITTLTPYRGLIWLLPSLRLAGCPGRMIIMAQLAVSVLAAAGLARLKNLRSDAWRVVLVILFGVAMVVESQPRVQMTLSSDVPGWVEVLRDTPPDVSRPQAVIDLMESGSPADLFYQTVHQHPIAMGETSRITADTATATGLVLDAVKQRRYDELARKGFAYIVDHASNPPLALPVVFADRRVRMYRLPQP